MNEEKEVTRSYSGALLGAIGAALALSLVGLIWVYIVSGRVSTQQAEMVEAKQQNAKLTADLRETKARLEVTTSELSKSLGMTEKQMAAKAQEIVDRQQAQEAHSKKLEAQQQRASQQISAVSSEVTTVKSDVGGVRTDLGKTQSDLARAVAQLTSMRGDLSDHASLIARNHDELEVLKHKGDRNYYEFSLQKGERKTVGSISLELKKADVKKSRFTFIIYADDKQYEKKDRNVNEPLQFYCGKEPALYEIVINTVGSKNQISGYLATPKNASSVR